MFVYGMHVDQRGDGKEKKHTDEKHLMIFALLADMRIFVKCWVSPNQCIFFYVQSKYFTLRCQKGSQQLEIDHFGFASLNTKSTEK